jgi:DNA repair protein RadA/Sms
MAKKKTVYECIECGYKSAKWMGKCPACGAWESFIEVSEGKSVKKSSHPSKILKFDEIEKEEIQRFTSGDSELDLVLGGGIVPGSLVLIGGSPGVGKSTLMM